ncbi:MAG: M15 family metallopeptidase [Erysipelotrichaceae bacterium]
MKKKIITLSSFIVVLTITLFVLIYLCFFSDKYFKNLGYTNQDIKLFHKYKIENQITQYNQSFVYALHSNDFNEKNIDYYLLFDGQLDYTDSINSLAEMYTLQQMQQIKAVLTSDQTVELIETDKIENIDSFIQLYNKGYGIKESVILANNIGSDQLSQFLTIKLEDSVESFVSLIKKGYDSSTLINLYNQLGEEKFALLTDFNYFPDLDDYLSCEGFNFNLLARYRWYQDSQAVSIEKAVNDVNKNYDFIEDPDFSEFYANASLCQQDSLTMVVSKSSYLTEDYIPDDLAEIDSDYRNGNITLNADAIAAFIQMSDDCYQQTDRRILIVAGYRSYQAEESLYNDYLANSDLQDDSALDSYTTKPGYSEHQTGLAIDICQKNYSYNEYDECISSDWVYENCYNYGFILRYPSSRAFITGSYFTSYHYRYVGLQPAKIIKTFKLTLEEYNCLFSEQ